MSIEWDVDPLEKYFLSTECSLNIVFFPRIFNILLRLSLSRVKTAIGCTKYIRREYRAIAIEGELCALPCLGLWNTPADSDCVL